MGTIDKCATIVEGAMQVKIVSTIMKYLCFNVLMGPMMNVQLPS